MVVTIPPSRAALLREFPELADYQRMATRLHPRPGAPDRWESSIGGPLLWPAAEPWPTCAQRHLVWNTQPTAEEQAASAEPLRRPMYRHEAHPEPVVLVPVLQLFKADAPQLDYPDGADLLQIVWCPNIHGNSVPWARVFWRRAADVRDPLAEMPAPNRKEGDRYAPRACVVHPEPVPEFPPICCLSNPRERYESLGKMPYDLEERVRAWSDRQPESGEYYGLAHAPGWKVGGWDISSPEGEALRGCPCGTDMQPLLTTDYDEDLDGWPPQQDPEFAWGDHRKWQDREPTGVNVTRSGIFVILQCPADPTHPLEHLIVY